MEILHQSKNSVTTERQVGAVIRVLMWNLKKLLLPSAIKSLDSLSLIYLKDVSLQNLPEAKPLPPLPWLL